MTTTKDDLFLIANLNPRLGESVHWTAHAAVRVDQRQFATRCSVIDGTLKPADLALLQKWVALNLDVLVRYWDEDIEFTNEAMDALRSI